MSPKHDIDYSRLVYYIIIACVILSVLWLNYCSFKKHVSSNAQSITKFSQQEDDPSTTRPAAVAGLFYSADKNVLNDEIDGYLANSVTDKTSAPKILVVPHAGYQYSAQTAAKAYAKLIPFADKIKNVILIGPAHRVDFKGVAISGDSFFITPLGKVTVNQELVQEFAQKPNFLISSEPHKQEHSLEVQLPFLQKTLKNASILPMVYGDVKPDIIAEAIEPYLSKEDTIIIVSADLSHYHDYETAQEIDNKTASMVKEKEANLEDHMSCGHTGINAILILAKKHSLHPELLDMRNSGDTAGTLDSVVGYAAWAFDKREQIIEPNLTPLEQEIENLSSFTNLYGGDLLKIAKKSIEEAVKEGSLYKPSRDDYADVLFDKGAAFVTIKKNGELRGCIGTLVNHQAIATDIAQNALSAALHDERFSPIKEEELKDLKVSISLLTNYEPVTFTSEEDLLSKVEANIDGLIIKDGKRQGVFLPSVWAELPDKQEFLNNLKVKAGFSPSYWSESIKVYKFRSLELE